MPEVKSIHTETPSWSHVIFGFLAPCYMAIGLVVLLYEAWTISFIIGLPVILMLLYARIIYENYEGGTQKSRNAKTALDLVAMIVSFLAISYLLPNMELVYLAHSAFVGILAYGQTGATQKHGKLLR